MVKIVNNCYLCSGMTVYFYHTQDTRWILDQWEQGHFPAHLLYGATHLPQYGIQVVPHLYGPVPANRRWRLTLLTTWRLLTCRQHFDAVYATSFRGLEGIVLLRAVGLWRRPVVLWHHQPIVKAANPLREAFARLFYRGIDHMFFFSQPLIDVSLLSRKARAASMQVVDWGADLEFYGDLSQPLQKRGGFISTGKEMRDMHTLVEAFGRTGRRLDIHVSEQAGSIDYRQVFGSLRVPPNVEVHLHNRLMVEELARCVAQADCVVICCRPSNYTVGLTTLVEALALGLPVIATRNTTFPFDIDREGVGLTVDYGDVDGWQQAIEYIATHPDDAKAMGQRGRRLAERRFNLIETTRQVCKALERL